LTLSAIEALDAHGSDELKKIYLEKLVSGEWTGTMQLTEPQAGSDVGALRTRAERAPDGSYRIKGTKIFITYGDHDMTDNIVHFVLARLPDAPAGTKGISLFLIPKFLVNADGSLGARNDIHPSGVEHKLGMHASPTCTMTMGDNGGAIGYLIGEENRGMLCMFTMMNQARLGVGLEGVGIADRAYQQALSFAQERKQGRAVGKKGDGLDAIIVHPDVKRMLLQMRAMTAAARSICYATAVALDVSVRAADAKVRADAAARGALLTPIAKAFSTDIGNEVTYLGVQVHGGMGFIEETGPAQHSRDARITSIYEGTNGIQSIDLVTRKLTANGGASVWSLLDELSGIVKQVDLSNDPAFGTTGAKLRDALGSLERASKWLLERVSSAPNDALAGATPYLRLFGSTLGGCMLAGEALAAKSNGDAGDPQRYVTLARFFAENISVQAPSLEKTVIDSADAVNAPDRGLRAETHPATRPPGQQVLIQIHRRKAANPGATIPMFDFDRVIDRRGTHASKWDNMAKLSGITAADAIPMWVADMDFAAPPGVTEVLSAAVARGVHRYYADTRRWAAALSQWNGRRHGVSIGPAWVSPTPGVVSGLGLILQAVT